MQTQFNVIGVMSGTSLDGLDIAYCSFYLKNEKWTFNINQATTVPYSKFWEERLKNVMFVSGQDLLQTHVDYGKYIGECVHQFIEKYSILKEEVDFISSHGHTVFHQPHLGMTYQIGNGAHISAITQLNTISDFRTFDVALGGQGAPLVPVGDHYLFHNYASCLNLGGFANISFFHNGKLLAFDSCPVNIVLNALAEQEGYAYDSEGQLAKQGTLNAQLLQQLNGLEFYKKTPPKSLGKEWVLNTIHPLLESYTPKDALATFTEHIAEQISSVLNDYQIPSVLITGGGAFNSYLLECIQEKSPTTKLILPDKLIINYKEALIFAFLGVLHQLNINNVWKSVTGSSKDHVGGVLHQIN